MNKTNKIKYTIQRDLPKIKNIKSFIIDQCKLHHLEKFIKTMKTYAALGNDNITPKDLMEHAIIHAYHTLRIT